jgi:hypothetical protein
VIHVPGRHLPPDKSAGDESTLGGYMAVHARPAAFNGPDGLPYSVDILTDDTGSDGTRFGAYLIFLKWRRMGEAGIDAHLETDFLAFGGTPEAARAAIGAMALHDVKAKLDALVRARGGAGERKWWDAMRGDDSSDEGRGA